jgi:ABC-type branched-subunit amino acid transport system permease subunit
MTDAERDYREPPDPTGACIGLVIALLVGALVGAACGWTAAREYWRGDVQAVEARR